MGTRTLNEAQIGRLARDLQAFVLSRADRLAESEGAITIRIYRKGDGFDIKLNVTSS